MQTHRDWTGDLAAPTDNPWGAFSVYFWTPNTHRVRVGAGEGGGVSLFIMIILIFLGGGELNIPFILSLLTAEIGGGGC